MKLVVKSESVVSTLSNIIQINVEIDNFDSTCLTF